MLVCPLSGGGTDPIALQTGLDKILTEPLPAISGQRFGLLFNQASLAADGRYAADAIASVYGLDNFKCVLSPQHGVWGEEQANMIETGHSSYLLSEALGSTRDKSLSGLPLYSLYSETRAPTDAMLDAIDVLVIDLQDVGTRVYTFIWTMLNCLIACGRAGKAVIVLDRPNPLGGLRYEGLRLADTYRSFVGLESLPMRHGLTIGECAQWFVTHQRLDVQLTVIPMRGWQPEYSWMDCGRHWFNPSPNMPTYRTTCVYPGGVLLEGTNLSEGRGTTIPFELVGAPFIDEHLLARELSRRNLPGVRFRPTRFKPTFDKWVGQSCHGVYLDVLDDLQFESYRTTVHLLHALRALFPEQFQWLPPPYEYEREKLPIDILTGGDLVRRAVDDQVALDELDRLSTTESSWAEEVAKCRLYPGR